MSQESYIQAGSSSTTFVGPDAVRLFQATAIAHAIDLYLRTGMKVNRAYTPQAMRDTASAITGRAYARSKGGLETAMHDLNRWIAEAKAQVPVRP